MSGSRPQQVYGDLDLLETTLRRDAAQIDLEKRRAMRGIVTLLERREAAFDDERQQAQRAELVRRRHHDPAARPGDPHELAHESPRILEVLDHFHGGGRVGRGRRDRQDAVEIDLVEVHFVREVGIPDRVEADAS